MQPKHHLASLQMAIMHVLWQKGEATIAEIRDALADSRPLAYTTVGTMLAKMERNGQVAHRTAGRVHVYRAAIELDQVGRSMVRDLASRLFGGDVTEMVSHLLESVDVSPDELERLKRLIEQKEQEAGGDG